jgi:hypothetical protein
MALASRTLALFVLNNIALLLYRQVFSLILTVELKPGNARQTSSDVIQESAQ